MSNVMNINNTRRVLNRDIIHATKFLTTLSRSKQIRSILARAAGYTQQDHALGWTYLHRATGYRPSDAVTVVEEPLVQQDALDEIDEWDGPAFERTRATWRLSYPSQLAYVFEGLSAEPGVAAINSTRIYIDRVVALRDGTDPRRAHVHEADGEAVALLAARRVFDADIQARLEKLIAAAAQLAPEPEFEPDVSPAELEAIARDLHRWLVDWRGHARAVIRRRDFLVRLGFPRRSSGDDLDLETGDDAEEASDEDPLSNAS